MFTWQDQGHNGCNKQGAFTILLTTIILFVYVCQNKSRSHNWSERKESKWMEGGEVTCYTSFPLAGCTENIPEAFYLRGRNKANVILPWPQDLHFNECWANCHVYVLYLSISISAAPSRLPLSYCLSPCQGAIICNLPKSSICRDTKHENGAIWCKMEAGEGLTYACVCVWRRLREVQLLVGGHAGSIRT